MGHIRVVLADDHPIVLAGIRALLTAADPQLELVGEATNGGEALPLIRSASPDVAVVDVSMPGLNGLELTERITGECPGTKVLVLTVHEDAAYVQPMLKAGARGYLLKRSAAEDLLRAIHAVAEGGIYLDPSVAGHALTDPSALAKGRRTGCRPGGAQPARDGNASLDRPGLQQQGDCTAHRREREVGRRPTRRGPPRSSGFVHAPRSSATPPRTAGWTRLPCGSGGERVRHALRLRPRTGRRSNGRRSADKGWWRGHSPPSGQGCVRPCSIYRNIHALRHEGLPMSG